MPKQEVYDRLDSLTKRLLAGGEISVAEGQWLIRLPDTYLSALMAGADRLRRHFRGDQIEVCAIGNVRSGNCSENCRFCAQSGHYQTEAPVHGYLPTEEVLAQAREARAWGVADFGIVSKGWGVRSDKERRQLREYLSALEKGTDVGRCASLGALDEATARELKAMGLENYHHNLETAERPIPIKRTARAWTSALNWPTPCVAWRWSRCPSTSSIPSPAPPWASANPWPPWRSCRPSPSSVTCSRAPRSASPADAVSCAICKR